MNSLDPFFIILQGLLQGAGITAVVTLSALALGLALGFALSLVRQFSRSKLPPGLVDVYVEFFRNIPALSHLFILYFGLASLGFRLSSMGAAILGLGLIGAAVTCDIFRSGFKSLSPGQTEAALATGLTPLQTIFTILTPQAMRIALPSIGNFAVQLLKDTSVVSAIAAPEIMFYARSMVTSSFQTTLIYATAAGLYLVMSLPLMQAVRVLENRYGRVK